MSKKIVITAPTLIAGEHYAVGDEPTVSDEDATAVITAGRAKLAEEKPAKAGGK